ncbi:MAG: phenylalanine--tRNA ligase subunit beta [Alkalispirochaeta sp.]
MPKIEVFRDALTRAINAPKITDDELEAIFPVAKAELDEPADAEGIMKVELNDTNRPDLWSTAGLARQVRIARGGELPHYQFFSDATVRREHGRRRVVVDPSVQEIRPYVVAFVMSGPPIGEAVLKDLIQTQEKLTWNFGRKRRSVAMGVYRSDLIAYPVHYSAEDPDATRFVPLQMERELSMREILTEHPKGVEFGHIVAEMPRFPLLTDDRGNVLSFPPVINSAEIGAVQEGDTTLFIELTGSDMDSLLLTASIVACDVADAGYTIEPVQVEYPYDTPYGREITVPYYFQKPQTATVAEINKLLGTDLSEDEIVAALNRMGVVATAMAARGESAAAPGTAASGAASPGAASVPGAGKIPAADTPSREIVVRVPEYRNDFLHAVDIVEDVMMGRGMDSFEPMMPQEFTVGRLTAVEDMSRRLKFTMVGLGFQEMIFNYLGSAANYIESMYPEAEWTAARERAVQIANPMSENYEFVRPSILPSLLSAESVSGQAVYPHHIFEIGNTAERDESHVSGTRTRTMLGFLSADRTAGFNLVNSHISAILYYVGWEYTVEEARDPRFIPGRAARIILSDGTAVGVFGELHPRALEAWGVQVPCTAGEIDIEGLLGKNVGGAHAS